MIGISGRTLGAHLGKEGLCRFRVWAPQAARVELHITSPRDSCHPMLREEKGYWHVELTNIEAGSHYFYRLNGSEDRPDPASLRQPMGVHGPSEVMNTLFDWQDASWQGLALEQFVFYELHVGTFTEAGTFDAVIPRLPELKELGITAIELMPVAQFPGARNWGYDGVQPFAAQESYGGMCGLQRFVDACHATDVAVTLDVVYNHLGPEGNYLGRFGPYFTDRYKTPWGPALNFDGPYSDEVRRFFIENALHWVRDFHIDALRLDAIHSILDHSAFTFLQELGEAIHALATNLGRKVHVIAESALNDARIVSPIERGGIGLDGQWNDDFHHALRTLLTGDRSGYYQDFGELPQLAKAFREGYVYTGEYSAFRKRRHGNASRDLPPARFVVFSQNHDQIGNRMLGDRMGRAVSFDRLKLAAAAVILSPFIPLLFMGEEYGEPAPFQYFVSHSDPSLIQAVRDGRAQEFADFEWQGEAPDPQDEETFARSKLNWSSRNSGEHRVLYEFYRELLRFRKTHPALECGKGGDMEVKTWQEISLLSLLRRSEDREACLLLGFGNQQIEVAIPRGRWKKLLDSVEARWLGSGDAFPDEFSSDGEKPARLNPPCILLLDKMPV